MNYTILKQWKTVTGEYHSSTVDKTNYDSAFSAFHDTFHPMQNDLNVAYFRVEFKDENGVRINEGDWTRPTEEQN